MMIKITRFARIRQYSTAGGKQNKFYIEKSNLDKSLHSKIPVVCLFGWTGAQDSHLKKYSDLYSDLGYHTIRFSPSNKLAFFKYKNHFEYANEFSHELKSEFIENPLMFHFFSNAGIFIIYHHLIRSFNQSEFNFIKQNQKGQIFDSGMGWPHSFAKLHKGIKHLLEPQIKSDIARRSIATFLCVLLDVYALVTRNDNYFTRAFDEVINDKRINLHSLYLYSKTDKLINPIDISARIEERKNKLLDQSYLKTVLYDEADHVLLYAKYPDDYLKHIKQHLKDCNLEIKLN